jgi:ABC-type Fe3+ transport system permease subunit
LTTPRDARSLGFVSPSPPARRRAPPFRPLFSLTLAYFAGFFLLFCLLIVAPALVRAAGQGEPSEEMEARAQSAAHDAIQGRLPIAFLGALVATGLGVYARALPGMRDGGPRR